STDIALLVDGEPQLTGDKSVAGSKVALPSIDIHTLGAGGGSIARADAGRILYVGPESAGAEPGPACYGRGGHAATVTDADLVLGYLDPENFLGGRRRLDAAAAHRAIAALATRVGEGRRGGAAALARLFAEMEAEGRRRLGAGFRGPVEIHRAVDMRYGEQIFEIPVSLDGVDLGAPAAMDRIVERFHQRHEAL